MAGSERASRFVRWLLAQHHTDCKTKNREETHLQAGAVGRKRQHLVALAILRINHTVLLRTVTHDSIQHEWHGGCSKHTSFAPNQAAATPMTAPALSFDWRNVLCFRQLTLSVYSWKPGCTDSCVMLPKPSAYGSPGAAASPVG